MSSVAYPILPIFSTSSPEKKLLKIKRAFWLFQQLLSKAQRHIINMQMSSHKVPVVLVRFR